MPLLLRQFIRFAGVGGIGFVVDGAILFALVGGGVDPFIARLMSFPFATFATWWFNRAWTFRDRSSYRARSELAGYLAVQLTGAFVNYCVYSLTLSLFGTSLFVTLLSFCFGLTCGFLLNFIGARHLVFR